MTVSARTRVAGTRTGKGQARRAARSGRTLAAIQRMGVGMGQVSTVPGCLVHRTAAAETVCFGLTGGNAASQTGGCCMLRLPGSVLPGS
ncbi:MAG: hypothetical protein INF92_04840 [Rhodobacter sp.]|nr:hypothetical protein [Rhodobacter sp.]